MAIEPHARQMPRTVWALVCLFLVWIVVMVTASQWRMAPTFDEQNHVTRGISILHTGDFRLCFHHPPFANVIEGLPVAWQRNGFSTYLPAWQTAQKNPQNIWPVSRATIWSTPMQSRLLPGIQPVMARNVHVLSTPAMAPMEAVPVVTSYVEPTQGLRLIHWARLSMLLFTLAMALLIFCWSRELFGPWGGVLSLALFALDPNVLAHSGLATTDIPAACTILLAVYLLRRYLLNATGGNLCLLGLGFGIALATKFSSLILLPILALTLLLLAIHPTKVAGALSARWAGCSLTGRIARAVGSGLLILLLAGVVLWANYGFKLEKKQLHAGKPVTAIATLKAKLPIPAMQYFRGLKVVKSEKHPTYINGHSKKNGKGWWYYFIEAVAVKTPIPELVLLLGTVFLLAVPTTRRQVDLPRREMLFLFLTPVLFLLAALGLLGISVNLGIRHVLPLYPFLFIMVGAWTRLRIAPRQLVAVLGVVLVAQCASVLDAYPDFLAYFNEPSTITQPGYRLLVDSNCDWGQDLGRLSRLQRKRDLPPLALSYFGSTPPDVYGLQYTPLAGYGIMDMAPAPDWAHFHGYIAISVTELMGGAAYSKGDYRPLLKLKPCYHAGKSILVYYVP